MTPLREFVPSGNGKHCDIGALLTSIVNPKYLARFLVVLGSSVAIVLEDEINVLKNMFDVDVLDRSGGKK